MKDIGGSIHSHAFTFVNMKDARDFAATHQITHIERSSTNLQDSIIASSTTPTIDRTHAVLSKGDGFLSFLVKRL